MNTEQANRMRNDKGFIAALDQSGGSTPKALRLYGISEDAYKTDAEMFDLVHQMRTRIMTSPSFTGEKILAAISSRTPWTGSRRPRHSRVSVDEEGIVPILKVDKGLTDEVDGAKLMKPIPQLAELLQRALAKGVFGTKMRSFIASANQTGINAVVDQQFEIGRRIVDAGLVPIIEPEVDIKAVDKAEAEQLMHDRILAQLDALPEPTQVMLADHTQPGQPVRRPHRAPTGNAGGGTVRRLQPSRGECAARAQPWPDRQLLAGTHRGADGHADRSGVRRPAGRIHRIDLPGINHVVGLARPSYCAEAVA